MSEETSLIVLRGGPRDGWVYDLEIEANKPKLEATAETFSYQPSGHFERRSDGALMQVYVPAPTPSGGSEEA